MTTTAQQTSFAMRKRKMIDSENGVEQKYGYNGKGYQTENYKEQKEITQPEKRQRRTIWQTVYSAFKSTYESVLNITEEIFKSEITLLLGALILQFANKDNNSSGCNWSSMKTQNNQIAPRPQENDLSSFSLKTSGSIATTNWNKMLPANYDKQFIDKFLQKTLTNKVF